MLKEVSFTISDLEGLALGRAVGTAVTIDVDAAGPASEAIGRMDLLTVVMHELGHMLGYERAEQPGLMAESLESGVRFRLPGPLSSMSEGVRQLTAQPAANRWPGPSILQDPFGLKPLFEPSGLLAASQPIRKANVLILRSRRKRWSGPFNS